MFLCALKLSKEIDEKGIDEMKSLKNEFKRSWIEMKKIKDIPEIYNTVIYIFLSGFIFSPYFGEFY